MNVKAKTRINRALSSFLAFVMILSMLPTSVFAAGTSGGSARASGGAAAYPDTLTISSVNYESVNKVYKSVNCGECWWAALKALGGVYG